ncbi:glycine-rich domain-containing protein [Streptomyces sp. NPDC007872]|uniref:glycine-rich domain-containing protein n=1 Tax=Streptomyces sp. NPDC007872 TaxID=3364782 RepID=UPI003673E319
MTITNVRPEQAASLLGPEMRADLIAFVREDYWPELTDDLGERGVDQMIAFLAVAGATEEKMAPSLRVDQFWHAFMLHTASYAAFCDNLGTGFIHHVPDRNSHNPAEGRKMLARTRDIIEAAGFKIDADFWPAEGKVDCTQSYAGCTDSPVTKGK